MKQITEKQITEKQIKELLKRVVETNYNHAFDFRNRLSLDGNGETYVEDFFLMDAILDLFELLESYSRGIDIETEYAFYNLAEFYGWNHDTHEFEFVIRIKQEEERK